MMASMVVGGTRKKSLTLNGVDPETCMIVFKNHWAQVRLLIFFKPNLLIYSPLDTPIATDFLSCVPSFHSVLFSL